MNEQEALQKVQRAAKLHRVAVERLHEARSRKLILCTNCGRRTVVSRLTYRQTHFYIEPYSCTGGDYWKEGEGRFTCPKCGYENRLYNRPDVEKLKPHFASVEDTHP